MTYPSPSTPWLLAIFIEIPILRIECQMQFHHSRQLWFCLFGLSVSAGLPNFFRSIQLQLNPRSFYWIIWISDLDWHIAFRRPCICRCLLAERWRWLFTCECFGVDDEDKKVDHEERKMRKKRRKTGKTHRSRTPLHFESQMLGNDTGNLKRGRYNCGHYAG